MNLIFKGFSAVALSLSAVTAFASPVYLITHNNTPVESNAYIAGVPSPYPTAANSTQKVYWNLVKLACYGHTTGKQCTAIIKMATNTANPIEVGELRMDLETGDITPKYLSRNGYTLFVNGLGEATITKN
ncbi:hypothetical protein [Legionella tucsonensis]|uniref:Uncharacterized protein n=1 Tax=Legionella tucsonensis TaxID=40335 RepID=A0A0W0ZWU7_9GAMM|nr:hypothetical protein [Legionella tucsonensis]KTD73633.1 hypothetical protein Ltuc_1480 [Legionella tucsonensis]